MNQEAFAGVRGRDGLARSRARVKLEMVKVRVQARVKVRARLGARVEEVGVSTGTRG